MSTSLLYHGFGLVGYRYVRQTIQGGRVTFHIEHPRDLMGAVLGPVATGRVSDHCARRAAAADGSTDVTELHKALGLRDAMYLIPILDAVLVVVLFAATWTVQGDYWRQQKRREASGGEGT